MNFHLETSIVLEGIVVGIMGLISWFIKGIYNDFKSSKATLMGLQLSVVELQPLLTVTEKEVAKISDKFIQLDGIKNDMAVMKRDLESAWRRIEQVAPRNNQ